ncbi:MAG: YkgJ family cysteine cluster protein [Spirochaetae bacterium HGW-Spirochaetae-8]|jgi:Fe-S-cluster containining protein|nr:MAG: YkgJ family cysteine cluster protein [Spirochaetae bacterium HGW-Spirochaetae-8]
MEGNRSMKEIHELCNLLTGTFVADSWRSLLELYDEAQLATDRFQQTFVVHCPQGCGTCCEHFVPELTEAEASLIAAYILFIKQDESLVERLRVHDGEAPCPLYDADSPYHCTVYPARGLICRLFGACPSEDKNGSPVFRKCKYNLAIDTPVFISAQDFRDAAMPVSTMREFGVRLSSMTGSQNPRSLAAATIAAISQLRFIAGYLGSDSHDDDHGGAGPDVPTPTPLAS